LILTKDQGHIIAIFTRQPDHIKGDTDINSFLLADQDRCKSAVREPDGLVTITKRTRKGFDPSCSHDGQFGNQKMVPEGVNRTIGYTGEEERLD
jgi:hypothetical protein